METIRYAPVGKEDCSFGTGSFEVTLSDGRVVMLSQIDLGAILSATNPALATQTLTNLTLGSGCTWAGTAIAVASGGTGSTTALAALQALGAIANKVTAKSSGYTVVAADAGVVFNCTNSFALTLTAAATLANGFCFGVANTGSGTITITPNGTEKINASTTMTVAAGQAVLVIGDGSTWWTIAFWPGYGASGQSIVSTGSGAAPSYGNPVAILRSYLAGFGLSNDGSTPNSVIDIAAGTAADSTNAAMITGTAFTKSTGGLWTAGTGNNGMGVGLTVANNTWYHVFAATISSAFDVFFDTSVTAANKPSGTTVFRRIGSFKTATGTTNILTFTQDGDYFRWKASILDVDVGTPGTTARTDTLTVPTGVNVEAMVNARYTPSAGNTGVLYLSDLAATDEAASSSAAPLGCVLGTNGIAAIVGPMRIRTNTSAQIRSRMSFSDGGTDYKIATLGWYDRRGRDA